MIRVPKFEYAGLMLTWFVLTGCAVKPTVEENRLFDATLWIQTSAEYSAGALAVYENASQRLREICPVSEKTAVVMDVDETVLDNSPFEATNILQGSEYDSDQWNTWVLKAQATPVPGALAYIADAQRCGLTVFFVTNRECVSSDDCPAKTATLRNLRQVGIIVSDSQLLLRNEQSGWGGDKLSRREYLAAQGFNILFLFGDDLNDFVTGVRAATPEQRHQIVLSHPDKWGKRWFMLPNPMYGSWKRVLPEPHSEHLRGY